MRFNWQQICESNRIPFVEHGPDVARGHINIKCPFCSDDPLYHMGLRLSDGAWGCWRNAQHRGRSPIRLLRRLLGISFQQALELVGDVQTARGATLNDLRSRLETLSVRESEYLPAGKFLPEFLPVAGSDSWGSKYLASRGFHDPDAVAEYYNIQYAVSGAFSGRVIFPVYALDVLVGWTARAWSSRATVRYKAHPPGSALRQTLFNFDRASRGGRHLIVVEGPVDAYKVDYYGRKFGVRAVALMSTSISPLQVSMLLSLLPAFDHAYIRLDPDALKQGLHLQTCIPVRIPLLLRDVGYEDLGAAPPDAIREFCVMLEKKNL